MPNRTSTPSVKDPELYETLRNEGESKEKAARIANAAAREGRSSVGRRGGRSAPYEEWTVEELRDRARELDLSGYSHARKAELIDMIRAR